jgi:hypothetical protein
MKNLMMILAVVALTVTFSSTTFAQGGKGNGKALKTNWVDVDNDGVCDNYTGTAKMNRGAVKPNFVDADGDGVCDNNTGTPKGQGRRANFVDADGDGVCDNVGTAPANQQLQDGTGTSTGTKTGFRRRGNK